MSSEADCQVRYVTEPRSHAHVINYTCAWYGALKILAVLCTVHSVEQRMIVGRSLGWQRKNHTEIFSAANS